MFKKYKRKGTGLTSNAATALDAAASSRTAAMTSSLPRSNLQVEVGLVF